MSSKKKITPAVDLGLPSIIPVLEAREKDRDKVIGASRPLVRHCALAIKMLHSGEIENAKSTLSPYVCLIFSTIPAILDEFRLRFSKETGAESWNTALTPLHHFFCSCVAKHASKRSLVRFRVF